LAAVAGGTRVKIAQRRRDPAGKLWELFSNFGSAARLLMDRR
jgi:hypothetical protein